MSGSTGPPRLPASLPFADDGLPAAETLLTDRAEPMLAAALEASGHDHLDSRISQVRYRPGRSLTVSYRTRITAGAARPTTVRLVAHAGAGLPAGAATLERDGVTVGVWRYPNDPLLPGLRPLFDTAPPCVVWRDLGIQAAPTWITTRAYRPLRRAVVEVDTPAGRYFLKVVRPSRADALLRRHAAAADAPWGPAVAGSRRELGIVAVEALPGEPLRDVLAGELPAPSRLVDLLDELPAVGDAAPALPERLAHHLSLIEAVVPAHRELCRALAAAIGAPGTEPPVPVHGDFHSGQVMVAGGRVAGLVDVDTLGAGQRADDLASMVAHLASLAADPAPYPGAAAYRDRCWAAFTANRDEAGLRRRVAAALVGFATMPFVTHRPGWPAAIARRLETAAQWAAR